MTGADRPKVIIFSRGRTGSNALFRAFSSHADVRGISEPFNRNRYEGRFAVDSHADLTRKLNEIWNEFNLFKHVWSESGWPFKSPHLTQQLLREPDAIYILLHRRNVLERYISAHIAAATRIWDGTAARNKTAVQETSIPPVDRRQLRNALSLELSTIAEYTAVLQARGVRFVELWYEELFADSRSLEDRLHSFEQLLAFAELDPTAYDRQNAAAALHPESKLNDGGCYRCVPDIEEIAAVYSSDSTGRLSLDS